MKPPDDKELRKLMIYFEVDDPSPILVNRVKRLMREELLQLSAEPARPDKWVILVVGLAVAMTLCLFYMLTVGTVLRFVLPPNLLRVLGHTLYAFTGAGGSLVVGAFMLFYFKYMQSRQVKVQKVMY
ncbi:hypothetical protein ACFL1R_10845 [Candidatus Latescibacterota bacterium]